MKILVTGGAGFIGSNIVRGLVRSGIDTITVLDDFSTGYETNIAGLKGVDLIRGDVRDAPLVGELVGRVDAVFHLAARVGNVRSFESPIDDASVNVIGTRNLLHAARQRAGMPIIYSSSAAIYGESQALPVDENHPVIPDSPYGVSKLAAERDVLCYGKACNLRVVCLRYFNVYGPHQRYDAYGNVIPIFASRLRRGDELIVYGDGEQTRDFVNVADVVTANIAALRSKETGVFNIATGRQTTVNELVDALRACAGKPVRVRNEPPRAGEVRHSYAAIDRAVAKLGYRPSVTIVDGLREYLGWFEREGS